MYCNYLNSTSLMCSKVNYNLDGRSNYPQVSVRSELCQKLCIYLGLRCCISRAVHVADKELANLTIKHS